MLKIEQTHPDWIAHDGGLYTPKYDLVDWTWGHDHVVLDGEFTAPELLQVACYMMRKAGRPGESLAARRIESAGRLSRTVRRLAARILERFPEDQEATAKNVREAL